MFAKGFLLLLLVITLLVMMFVLLIISFFKRKNKPLRNRYLFTSGAMLVFGIISGGYLSIKTLQVGKLYGEKIAVSGSELMVDALSPRFIMSYPLLQKLTSMQPSNVEIPKEYYTYAGVRDYYRMPLIYPYSLNAIDTPEDAYLCDETGIKIFSDVNRSKQILHGILRFSFDSKTLYAVLDGRSDTETIYAVFHFDTGGLEIFKDEEKAKIAARLRGLDPDKSIQTVKEYHDSFARSN